MSNIFLEFYRMDVDIVYNKEQYSYPSYGIPCGLPCGSLWDTLGRSLYAS